jgi:hypothetical protein
MADFMMVDPPAPRLLRKGAMGVAVLTFGYMNGRYNNPTIPGTEVPVDLAMALLTTLGHVGLDLYGVNVPGPLAATVDAISDGAIASFMAKVGTGFGAEQRKGSSDASSSSSTTKGYESLPVSVGALSASEAEIYVR